MLVFLSARLLAVYIILFSIPTVRCSSGGEKGIFDYAITFRTIVLPSFLKITGGLFQRKSHILDNPCKILLLSSLLALSIYFLPETMVMSLFKTISASAWTILQRHCLER